MGKPTELAKMLKWQDPSKFKISIIPIGGDSSMLQMDPDTMTASLTSIQLPDFNTGIVEEWIGEEWRFTTGRIENYLVQLTFKDYNNFTMYKLWSKALQKFLRSYPDDQKFDIKVDTAEDFTPDSTKPTITFKDCILTTVSGPNLDNSANASVAEFSVTCKASWAEVS